MAKETIERSGSIQYSKNNLKLPRESSLWNKIVKKMIPGPIENSVVELKKPDSTSEQSLTIKTDATIPQPSGMLGNFGKLIIESAEHDSGVIFEEPKKLSKRQRLKRGVKAKALSIKEIFEWPKTRLKAEIAVAGAERNIMNTIKPQYPEKFEEILQEIMKTPNAILVIISNHQALPDGAATAFIARAIGKMLNLGKVILTIASSLESGHQNILVKEVIKATKRRLPKWNMDFASYTRDKDKDKYDLGTDTEYMDTINAIARKDPKRKGDILAFYLPGNMEEGRRITEGENVGKIKGLQELHCQDFHRLMFALKMRYHREPILLPMTIEGANRLLDPSNDNRITEEAEKIITQRQPPEESMLKVKMGLPKPYFGIVNEVESETGQKISLKSLAKGSKELDYYVGKKMLAPLLSPGARGVYV